MPKPRHRSRTLWLNGAATAAAAVLSILAADPSFLELLGPVGTRLLLLSVGVLGAVNVGLRLATSQPLEGTPAAREQERKRVLPPEPRRPPRRSSG